MFPLPMTGLWFWLSSMDSEIRNIHIFTIHKVSLYVWVLLVFFPQWEPCFPTVSIYLLICFILQDTQNNFRTIEPISLGTNLLNEVQRCCFSFNSFFTHIYHSRRVFRELHSKVPWITPFPIWLCYQFDTHLALFVPAIINYIIFLLSQFFQFLKI